MFPTQTIKIRLNTNTNSSDTHPLPKRKPRASASFVVLAGPCKNASYADLVIWTGGATPYPSSESDHKIATLLLRSAYNHSHKFDGRHRSGIRIVPFIFR